jgi:hypothetical protein
MPTARPGAEVGGKVGAVVGAEAGDVAQPAPVRADRTAIAANEKEGLDAFFTGVLLVVAGGGR